MKEIPLLFEGKQVGKVLNYTIVGNDKNGLPIVCIDGVLDNANTFDLYPMFRYTVLTNEGIKVLPVEQKNESE